MPIIVIAYTVSTIDGNTVRIYNDFTEKYFEDSEDLNTKEYITYLSDKGYSVEASPIKIYSSGEFDAEFLIKENALAKLTDKEKEVLGL